MAAEPNVKNHYTPNAFQVLATRASFYLGTKWAFAIAIAIIVTWALLGPLFKFSDGWQLVINTATTIVTFLMVFLIQNTQNRDARAIHLKLDEIIHAIRAAHNDMIDIEKLSDAELEALAKKFEQIRTEPQPRKPEQPKSSSDSSGHALVVFW